MQSNERRHMTWKDLAIWVVAILISLSGYLLNDLYGQVKKIQDDKLDSRVFYDVADRMDKKSDLIIQLLRDHELSAKKMSYLSYDKNRKGHL